MANRGINDLPGLKSAIEENLSKILARKIAFVSKANFAQSNF